KKARKIDAKVSILEILQDEENSYEYLVVVSNDQILGILSQSDIINNIDPEILMHRQSIGNLILQYAPVTLYENEAAINAIKLMQLKHIDAIIIIDQTNTPCGIFTSKDFLNIINDDADLSLPINNFMSSPILTLPDTVRIYKALEFIKEKHFKRIVVKDQTGQISGVITQSELLRIVNNKWLDLIKEKGNELSKINEKLLKQTAHLEKKASTDFLTQLHNRRKFDSIISYELQQLKRYTKRDLSVILLDIDGFKYINDTYGHNIGDEILKEIAKILKVTLRTSDVACRWGGEEFAIALSETNIESAYLVAEKLRATIENYIFIDELRITCSFGVSQYQTTDDYPILFKRADEALYKAKNTGKNKVVIEHI
ncbi:MAG: GGDEF domain-containing protein, partial [Campylobacterota bacterium]|nr:GGDEF domain-containing protein [Campylobacterota bacterium]